MGISANLTDAKLVGNIRGNIISIEVDTTISGSYLDSNGIPLRYIIVIEETNRREKVVCYITGREFLQKSIDSLGLTSELKFKLRNGIEKFSIEEKASIVSMELYVSATVDEAKNSSSALPSARKWIKNIQLISKNEAYFGEEFVYEAGVAENWPEPDTTLPFTPIKVPMPSKDHTRIGYAVFSNPVNYITTTRSTQIDQLPAMRLPGTIKKGAGKAYESYTITYVAQGALEIQKSVREVFEQISLTPFTSVEGGPFGLLGSLEEERAIKPQAIAVRNFSLSTLEGYPNAVQVEISFDAFDWQFYLPMSDNNDHPVFEYNDVICWPLVKCWAKRAEKSFYNGGDFNGKFGLYFPTKAGAELANLINLTSDNLDIGTDFATLSTFKNILSSERGTGSITSRNIKEIMNPISKNLRTFVLRVKSKELFNKYINLPNFWGLSVWDKYSASNFVDHQGKFLPESALIDNTYFSSVAPGEFKQYEGIGQQIQDKLNLYINISKSNIVFNASGGYDANDAITNFLTTSGVEYSETQLLDAKENPQNTFALVLFADEDSAPIATIKELTTQEVSRASREDINFFQSKNAQIKDLMNNSFVGKNTGSYLNGRAVKGNLPNTSIPMLEVGIGGKDTDVVIERIGASRGHNLALFSQRGEPLPVHQYMGGMDATFIVQGKCFSNEAKRKLERIKEEFDQRAISKKSTALNLSPENSKSEEEPSKGFLFIDNEIFSLLGVNFVLPVTLQFQTVDQQPGVWNFTFSFIEYNFELKTAEEVKFLPTSWDKLGKIFNYGWGSLANENPTVDKAIEYFNLQAELAREEVYPDLSLPTLGELAFWIKAIYKGAKNYYEKTEKYKLTQNETYIVNMVANQFFPSDAKTIATKWFPEPYEKLGEESGAFAEPDFYVYYTPDESFGNIFDALSEHQLGVGPQHKIKNKEAKDPKDKTNKNNKTVEQKINPFAAAGRPGGDADPTKKPTGVYREYDPNYNVTTIFPTEMYAVNGVKYPIGLMRDKVYKEGIMPPENAELAKSQLKQAQETLDTDPQAWWSVLESKYAQSIVKDGEKVFSISSPQEDAMAEVYSFTSDIINKANLVPITESEGSLYNKAVNDTDRYFTIDWRQSITNKVTSFLPEDFSAETVEVKLRTFAKQNTKFFFNRPSDLLPESGGLTLSGKDEQLSIKKIEELIFFNIHAENRAKTISEKVSLASQIIAVGGFVIGAMAAPILAPIVAVGAAVAATVAIYENFIKNYAVSDLFWLSRCSLVNKNWLNVSNDVAGIEGATWVRLSRDVGVEGIISDWTAFDRLGRACKFDPHVLRAFFLRRDGYGRYKPAATSKDTGFGDLSLDGTKEEVVLKVAQLYLKYAKLVYNIPSLVLLCLNLRLTSKCINYRDETGEIKEDVLDNIVRTAELCKNRRFSKVSIDAIASILNKYSEGGLTIDQYYSAYIGLCRVFGVYDAIPGMDKWRDPYFHSYNLLNLIDTDDNTQIVNTKFCPTKSSVGVGIPMNRGDGAAVELDPYAKEFYEGYDKNNSSIDLEAALAKKMQGSLDPHSETSIYGSMVDFRTHAPIGKLRGAFPSFQILLINEGFYWNGGSKKLWDQFYTRTGVASIEVFRTRHKPGATASVTFSNMFHNLTNYALMEAIAHRSAVQNNQLLGKMVKSFGFFGMIGEIWNMLVIKNVPEDARKIWQNNHLKKLALSAGTRLQIRMGYGSNAARLPVVFNGTVVDVPVADGYVNITAVSDGHELEKPCTTRLVNAGSSYAFQDGGKIMGVGADPSLIVKHALIAASWFDNVTGGNFRDQSSGIAHFGETFFTGALRYTAEVEFNIYAARRTKIEQGIGELSAYSLVNGIVNWENERNLFSVSVQQPTPWKVMEVCRRACSDFVAAAEPFAMRSSVFFGKWWWPYHFTYHESILQIQAKNATILAASAPKDWQSKEETAPKNDPGKLVSFTKYTFAKPFDSSNSSNNIYHSAAVYLLKGADGTIYKVETRSSNTYTQGAAYYPSMNDYDIVDKVFRMTEEAAQIEINTRRMSPFNTQVTTEIQQLYEKAVLSLSKTERDQLQFIDPTLENSGVYEGLRDVTNLQLHLRWKPYMQAYIAHSAINLLDNSIRADSSRVVTDAIGMHQYNGWLSPSSVSKTITYSVDTDIHASDRKTMMVDTGIMLTGLQAGGDAVAGGIVGLLEKIPFVGGGIFGGVSQYIEESPTTPAIENSVVSALVDQVKEMYQGWFTIQGMSSVKPKDLFYFTDHVLDMKGPVFVKEVIHRMDAQTGFITMVSPDAVVLPHDSIIGAQLVTSLSTGPLQRLGSFYMLKAASAGMIQAFKNKFIYHKGGGELSESYRKYKHLQKRLSEANDVEKMQSQYREDLLERLKERRRLIDPNYGINEWWRESLIKSDPRLKEMSELIKSVENANTPKEVNELLEGFIQKTIIEAERTEILTGAYSSTDLELLSDLISTQERYQFSLDTMPDSAQVSKAAEDLKKFEEDLKKETAKMQEDLKKGRAKGATSAIWTDDEIDSAVSRFADERRAEFYTKNKEELEVLNRNLGGSTDEATKEIEELRHLLKRKAQQTKYKTNKFLDTKFGDTKRIDELISKINKRLQDGEFLDDVLKESGIDRILKGRIIKPTVWTDSQNKSVIKAAVNAVVDTPKSVAKGTSQLGAAMLEEIMENWKYRKEAVKVIGGTKAWLIPTPLVKFMVDQKKSADAAKVSEEKVAESVRTKLAQQAIQAAPDHFVGPVQVKNVEKDVEEAVEAVRKVRRLRKFAKLKKDLETAALAVRMLKYMGPQAVLGLAVDVSMLTLGGSFIEGHNARLRARQAVKIIPLRVGKLEYVAGIRGHEGAVIGDNPSWADELISGLHGVPNDVLSGPGVELLGFVAQLNGIEYPQAQNKVDAAYIKALQEEENPQDSINNPPPGE